MPNDSRAVNRDALTRRDLLQRGGGAGVALLGGTLWATAPAAAAAHRARSRDGRLRHIIISCQENRSFDHYYGFARQVQAGHTGHDTAPR